MVANKVGLTNVKRETNVDHSEAIFELDESFKCFADNSRYFANEIDGIDKAYCKNMCEQYCQDRSMDARSPFGFNNDELMLSFFHNTPNNTLPIFWTDAKDWFPLFNRSIKKYQ